MSFNRLSSFGLFSVLTLSLLAVGCGQSVEASKEMVPVPTLEGSLEQVTGMSDEILTAFEAGDLDAAHPPLHKIGKVLETIEMLVSKLGLEGDMLAGVKEKIQTLFDSYGKLDGVLHHGMTDDFDLAPIAEKIRGTLPALIEQLTSPSEEAAAEAGEAAAE